jgi:type II secretory pathway component PulC
MEDLAGNGVRVGVGLWVAIVAGAIAWLVSYWFWQVSVRPVKFPAVSQEIHPEKLAQQVRARQLFGKKENLVGAAATTASSSHLALVGIVSALRGKGGLAVILIDGKKAVTVKVGEEITPGLTLSKVAQDQVELSRNGQLITLMLSAKK